MNRTAQIDTERANAFVALSELKAQHAQLSLQVSEQPANAELHSKLDALDADIAATEKTIARLAAAREEAQRKDAADARTAAIGVVQNATAAALGHANDRVAIGKQIDELLWQLAGALSSWETASLLCRKETLEVANKASLSHDLLSGILHEALAPFAPAPFIKRLTWAGVGVRGIDCRHVSGFHLPHVEENITVEDAAALAAKRLLARLKPIADKAVKELSK